MKPYIGRKREIFFCKLFFYILGDFVREVKEDFFLLVGSKFSPGFFSRGMIKIKPRMRGEFLGK